MDTVLLLIMAGLCAVSSHAARQYHFVYEWKTWTEAQSYCRENYTDLATVDNMEDVTTLINMADTSKLVYPHGWNNLAWIGLYREDALSSWKWSDGSSSSFRPWMTGQPDNAGGNQHCVAADFGYSGQWRDLSPYKIAFICYSPPTSQTTSSSTAGFSTPPHYLTTSSETQPESATTKQVFRLKFQTQDSSLDPNDPAVMEDMLKKLKQQLKDQGMDDNIKLSWRKQPDGKVFHKEEKKKKTKKDEL